MFAVLWDNFGDVNGRFFPYFAQLETISIFRRSKKDKGVREKRRRTQILLSLWYVIVYRTSPKKEILRFQSATKAFQSWYVLSIDSKRCRGVYAIESIYALPLFVVLFYFWLVGKKLSYSHIIKTHFHGIFFLMDQ